MCPLLSSLFLSTYCSIILVLNTWRRRWNTWTNVNIFDFMKGKIAKSYWTALQFSVLFFENLVVRKTFSFSISSLLQLIANHACSMISFILLKSLCTTTSTLSIFLVLFEIYSLSEQDAGTQKISGSHKRPKLWYHVNHFCLLSYAWKFWNCKSFYRLEIGSSSWYVKVSIN